MGTSCLGYEMSWVRVVLGMNCLGYEMSWVRVVLGTSCPGYELSWVRVVQIPWQVSTIQIWNHCGQILHSAVDSNQVGCSCTWQRSLFCETNTGATKEILTPNQSWRGCDHSTLNWPYQGHQIPYLVPRTPDWLSPLWSNTDDWPCAAGVCIATGMLIWILYSRLVECSLQDNS